MSAATFNISRASALALSVILLLPLGSRVDGAEPGAAFFAGNYSGSASLAAPDGASRVYLPVRVRVTARGTLSGSAISQTSDSPVRVVGRIRRIRRLAAGSFEGRARGRFADGLRWDGSFVGSRGIRDRSLTGTCRSGNFVGKIALASTG